MIYVAELRLSPPVASHVFTAVYSIQHCRGALQPSRFFTGADKGTAYTKNHNEHKATLRALCVPSVFFAFPDTHRMTITDNTK
jgi:hypothetical protein